MNAIALDFAVKGISEETARHVREHGVDPIWGHVAVTQPAIGFGPCRVCLRTFREGEEHRILFTHDTYAGLSEFPQPGPRVHPRRRVRAVRPARVSARSR